MELPIAVKFFRGTSMNSPIANLLVPETTRDVDTRDVHGLKVANICAKFSTQRNYMKLLIHDVNGDIPSEIRGV